MIRSIIFSILASVAIISVADDSIPTVDEVRILQNEIAKLRLRLAPLDSIEKRALELSKRYVNCLDTIPLSEVPVDKVRECLQATMADSAVIAFFDPQLIIDIRKSDAHTRSSLQRAETFQQLALLPTMPYNKDKADMAIRTLSTLANSVSPVQRPEVEYLSETIKMQPTANEKLGLIIARLRDEWVVIPDADTARDALNEVVRPQIADYLRSVKIIAPGEKSEEPELLFPSRLINAAGVLNQLTSALQNFSKNAKNLSSDTALKKWVNSLNAKL